MRHHGLLLLLFVLMAPSWAVAQSVNPPSVAYDSTTGQFSVVVSTPDGTLGYTGTLEGLRIVGTGVLQRHDQEWPQIEEDVSPYTADVTWAADESLTALVGYSSEGAVRFTYAEDGGHLKKAVLSDCAALKASPQFQWLQATALLLLERDRSWDTGPDAASRLRIIQSMLVFSAGTELVPACGMGLLPLPLDNRGCDLGPLTWVVSCGDHGLCCDWHDSCYSSNQCTASSWLGGHSVTGACGICNVQVANCFSMLHGPGPSECCDTDSCGDPRVVDPE